MMEILQTVTNTDSSAHAAYLKPFDDTTSAGAHDGQHFVAVTAFAVHDGRNDPRLYVPQPQRLVLRHGGMAQGQAMLR